MYGLYSTSYRKLLKVGIQTVWLSNMTFYLLFYFVICFENTVWICYNDVLFVKPHMIDMYYQLKVIFLFICYNYLIVFLIPLLQFLIMYNKYLLSNYGKTWNITCCKNDKYTSQNIPLSHIEYFLKIIFTAMYYLTLYLLSWIKKLYFKTTKKNLSSLTISTQNSSSD